MHWNESGTSFLLETVANNGVQNLWRVEIDPSTQAWTSVERLTTGSGADMSAARSPDGRRVAFSTQRVFDRMWRFPIDSVKRTLSDGQPLLPESTLMGFDISRDGRMAVFTPLRAGSYDMNLWTASVDSGSPKLVAESAAFGRWSPDGKQMAYIRQRAETIDHGTGTSEVIIAVRTTDGEERQVTSWARESLLAPGLEPGRPVRPRWQGFATRLVEHFRWTRIDPGERRRAERRREPGPGAILT